MILSLQLLLAMIDEALNLRGALSTGESSRSDRNPLRLCGNATRSGLEDESGSGKDDNGRFNNAWG